MTSTSGRLRVVASTPISEDLIAQIVRTEPRIDFIRDQSLLPPQRFAGDHSGDPSFQRTPAQQTAFDELVDSAEALYGVPDEKPASLARTALANPALRWVHTMPAGGGAQVKAAGLADADLGRVAFSTSAGVHAEPLAEYAVFGLMAAAKNLPRLLAQQQNTQWTGRWEMGLISQQRILLVGLGSIGRATAIKMKALGATVIGTSRSNNPVTGVDEIVHPDELADAVHDVDGIVVSLPGTAATEGLLSADVFASEPLNPQSPLWHDPNVLISPHTAALNSAEDRLIAQLFARNATRFLDGQELINRVDTVEFY